jgi:hypothetical protein
MRQLRRPLILLAAGTIMIVAACESPILTEPRSSAAVTISGGEPNGIVRSATGGGRYLLQGAFDVQFAFSALQHASGAVMGKFHESFDAEGETIDFRGDVTCMAVDAVNHRAWIGAVITENRSTHPDFQEWYHQPGEDVWFRVVDYGEGAAAPPDRKTFMGFENTPGIPSSEIYCQLQIWPPDDARTWPVTAGNIQVRPEE